MTATLYLNLEDDIAKIVAKLRREKASDIVLVCPKRSFLFSDSINLRLLKKKVDLLGKSISILTMDEQGQSYAKQAGFALKHMPKPRHPGSFSDIRPSRKLHSVVIPELVAAPEEEVALPVVRKLKTPVKTLTKKVLRPKPKLAAPVMVLKSPVATVRGPDNVYIEPEPETEFGEDTTENFVPTRLKSKKDKLKKPRSRKATAWIVSFVGLCLILLLVLVLFILPRADITVYGKTQTIARDVDINLDTKVKAPDAASLAMPAVPFDETPNATVTLETTGKKEIGSKAEGQVAIYNLTGQPLNLKASTTILTIGTKTYQFLEDQNNIKPAASATDDKSATIARVIAKDGGESFNAPSQTRMEITNQAFGAQPQRLFAKASTQIVGGNSRFISVVSDEDIKNAQDQLKQKLLDQVKNKQKQQNLILLDDASTMTVNQFIPDKVSGTESPTITVQGQLRITGLAFDESVLRDILRNRISNSLASGRKLQASEADTVSYKVKSMDVQAGTLALSLHYESQAKLALDSSNLSTRIVGKSQQEASEILLSNEAIEKVEILLYPSFQRNIPLFKGKINIKVKE